MFFVVVDNRKSRFYNKQDRKLYKSVYWEILLLVSLITTKINHFYLSVSYLVAIDGDFIEIIQSSFYLHF